MIHPFETYLGLKKNTYLAVIALLAFIAVVAVVGHKIQRQRERTMFYYNQVEAMKYVKPTIDLQGKDKAIYIIRKVWRKDWKTGVILASCESGFRETVVNSIGATGYFQIMAGVHGIPQEELQDGWVNSGFAYSLYKEQGLTPWVSSNSCHHLIK